MDEKQEEPDATAERVAPQAGTDEPSHVAVGVGVIGDGETGADGAPVEGEDHHGQDGSRDTVTAGEAQREGALGSEQEQRLPAMAQNNASEVDKVAGIVVQTRSDVGTEPVERIQEVLRQRLEQAGVDLPEDEIAELARQVAGPEEGDAR